MELIEYDATTQKLKINLHVGQQRAQQSRKQVLLVIAGTQSGKTSYGPVWLLQEIQRCGPGDYLVVTPTYPLFNKKLKGEFLRFFETFLELGKFKGSPENVFEFSEDGEIIVHGKFDPYRRTRVLFGHAQNPESLESATAKAAWLDEAGQTSFRLGSWNAIRRRLSLAAGEVIGGIPSGRILITTTPYSLGWLKRKLHDPYYAAPQIGLGVHDHEEIDLINFWSIHNPSFPRKEWDRAMQDLPEWQFNMMYKGIFTKPAGMIYDSFDPIKHSINRFPIPDNWLRYVGVDFGAVNTAAIFFAEEPKTKEWFLYDTYHAGGRTTEQHANEILRRIGSGVVAQIIGGAPSEDQQRRDFTYAGLPIQRPKIKDVEVGINRVYAAHRRDLIYVFDDMDEYIDEKLSYSRELDDMGEPTEKIKDKSTFHLMDTERYIVAGRSAISQVVETPKQSKLPPIRLLYGSASFEKHHSTLPFPFND